jgi:RimJ/RimL family protein N-acetyltransferase
MREAYRKFLEGDRVYLREVVPSDVTDRYIAWLNDPEVTAGLEIRFQPHSKEGILEYVHEMAGSPNHAFLAVVVKEDDRHIGNIKLGPINWVHRRGDIGILIGEKDCWGRGYGTEAIRLLVRHAFMQLNLHRLVAGVYEDNPGSIRAFQKNGFDIEGIMKDHCFSRGRYVNGVLLGLVRSEPPNTPNF